MIRFTCPECETGLKAAEEKAGTKIACPRCKTKVQVPGKAGAAVKRKPEMDDEEDEAPAPRRGKSSEKTSSMPMYVGIGIGAIVLLSIAGGILGAKFLGNKGNTDTGSQAQGNPPVLPQPTQGGGTPTTSSSKPSPTDKKNTEKDTKQEPPKKTPELPEPVAMGSGEKVYERMLKSAVWIIGIQKDGKAAWSGSGSVVDVKNKLILTNHHVSRDKGEAELKVIFPAYDQKGELIREAEVYEKRAKTDAIPAWVELARSKVDLAIIKVPGLPENILPIPMAGTSARPGQTVYSIGSPAGTDSLWHLAPGTVRQVSKKTWRSVSADHEARVVEAQTGAYHGDSGGPMVNQRCEMVAVTQGGGHPDNPNIGIFIDISEVRTILNDYYRSQSLPLLPESTGTEASVSVDVTGLVKLLADPDAQKRADAARTLGRKGEEARRAVPDLVAALKDKDADVRRNSAEALELIRSLNRTHVPALVVALKDPDVDVRISVASALSKMGLEAKAAVPALISSIKDSDAKVRLHTAAALAKIGEEGKEAIPSLTEALEDTEIDVRCSAALALAKMGSAAKNSVPNLVKVLKNDTNKDLRRNVIAALEGLGPNAKESIPELKALLRDRDKDIQGSALTALAAMGPEAKDAVKNITLLLEDKDLRGTASETLAKIGKPAVPELIKALTDAKPEVRLAAVETLGQIGPEAEAALPALGIRKGKDLPEIREAAYTAIKKIHNK